MASGYQLRKIQAHERVGDQPCPCCEHPRRLHRELRPTFCAIVDGPDGPTIAETPNPEYQPFHFHCESEGCDCVLDRTAVA